jgi:hypothetical protein
MNAPKLSVTRGDTNANGHMDGARRRSRDWPDLVARRDARVGPREQRGNEVGRGIAVCDHGEAE